MQQNIRIYRDLELKAEAVQKNIIDLTNIQEAWNSWKKEEIRLLEQQFLYERAEEQCLLDSLEQTQTDQKKLEAKLESLREEEQQLCQEQSDKVNQINELRAEIERSDIRQKEQSLANKIGQFKKQLSGCNSAKQRLHQKLNGHFANWAEIVQATATQHPTLNQQARQLTDALQEGQVLLKEQRYQELLARVVDIETLAQALHESLVTKRLELRQQLDELKSKSQELRLKIQHLEQGIKSFDPRLKKLKSLIETQVPGSNPRIFCDLLEISDERWQNAIEGYLHTQKFYLMVEPKFFIPALKIYDREKQRHNLHSFGLVDVAKLITRDISIRPDSLAQYLTTDDPHARALADYLLGRVIGCAEIYSLRDYDIAITPGCMLYQNYVARQLDPARYRDPFIGKQAVLKQIKNAKEDLKVLAQEIKAREQELSIFKAPQFNSAQNSLDFYTADATLTEAIPVVQAELTKTEAEYNSLDLTWLDRQKEVVTALEQKVDEIRVKVRNIVEEIGATSQSINTTKSKIPQLRFQAEQQGQFISENYEPEWIQATGEPRFNSELQSKSPETIKNNFNSQVARTRNQATQRFGKLKELREDYNRTNHLSFYTEDKSNSAYEDELAKLEETYLREYQGKIKDARQRAERQFREDFISKLRNNIETAQQQLEDVNRTLKNIPFGQERYRFKVQPGKGRKKFYDMIMDDLLLQGNDLFSGTFQEKHKEALDDLFRKIVPEESLFTADARTELEKNLEQFTDYRKYLEFDLISIDNEGRETRLSKMLSKRSGGETQNPFYIAVLASFAHVYRTRSHGYNDTMRLIVFDEAFNKMDHQRIEESIKLAKKLGLQLVISAPTEKVADIAPLVDRTHIVVRIKSQTSVRHFDPKALEESV